MARLNFPGATQAELKGWLKDVNEEIATGKVNIEFGAGDSNFKAIQDQNLKAERRRDLILADLVATKVPGFTSDMLPVKRTAGRFNDW